MTIATTPSTFSPKAISAGTDKCQPTTIGESTQIVGELFASGDLKILGEVQGRIICRGNVTVSAGATVLASVEASSIVIIGAVQGIVSADKIDIRQSARLVGDIKCARLAIEDGAYFKGSIDISARVRPQNKLALQGSREAEELDRIAESDIETGRYATLGDDVTMEQFLPFEALVEARQTSGQTISKVS